MTTRAVQLITLKNSLAACSKELQAHVNKTGILKHNAQAVANRHLQKLVLSEGLGAAVGNELDQVLNGPSCWCIDCFATSC